MIPASPIKDPAYSRPSPAKQDPGSPAKSIYDFTDEDILKQVKFLSVVPFSSSALIAPVLLLAALVLALLYCSCVDGLPPQCAGG